MEDARKVLLFTSEMCQKKCEPVCCQISLVFSPKPCMEACKNLARLREEQEALPQGGLITLEVQSSE